MPIKTHVAARWKAYLGGTLCIAISLLIWGLQLERAGSIHDRSQSSSLPPAPSPSDRAGTIAAAQPVREDLTTLFPPSQLPLVATQEGARTSLRYLADNGADLARPMPSKHRVFAANAQLAAQLATWGHASGFEVRGPVLVRSHTGKPQQTLEFVRTEIPDPAQIEREGRLILAAVQRTPGTYYQTWCGEIVR